MSSLDNCVPATFSAPSVFGAEILAIDAQPVLDYNISLALNARIFGPATEVTSLDFCNVTVTYTHPGTDDVIHVETWLPDASAWNERYYAAGGGGFAAGRIAYTYESMAAAASQGYASSTTDAGVGVESFSADAWALLSPGNLNLHKIRSFGTVSLNDQAIINKHIIEEFYGKRPTYSYWNGCSQGGRQGSALAQRYPTAYDGILAGAPALRLPQVVSGIFAPQQVMNVIGEYPYPCEFDAIRMAAVEFCDGLDGIVDGVVTDIDRCSASFDPFALIGKAIECPQAESQVEISLAAATVVNRTWAGGFNTVGRRAWFGFSPSTDLTGNQIQVPSTAMTNCTGDGCTGLPHPLGDGWMRMFVGKDPDFDYSGIPMDEFLKLTSDAAIDLKSFFGTDDADLSEFRDAGGKMLTYHGLDDNLISYQNTRSYYSEVTSFLSDVDDFYRYFEVPGLAHCSGGTGGEPLSMFETMRAWVEEGVVPNSAPIGFTDAHGTEWSRVLCPFPQVARYQTDCGDATSAECWVCEA